MIERPSIYDVPVVRDVFVMGLDLGQLVDYTAISVLRVLQIEGATKPTYVLGHLERPKLGTTYPAVVERVRTLLATPPFSQGLTTLVVDGTGNVAVVNLLRDAGLHPVAITISGGQNVTPAAIGGFVVPKRDLVQTLQVVHQTKRLLLVDGLTEGPTLIREILNFHPKIDPVTGHDSYEASGREGIHDDLVVSVSLAVWYYEQASKQASRTRSAY